MSGKTRIFLSYKRTSGPQSRRDAMKVMLEGSGEYDVNFDEKGFTPGIEWRPQIFENISDSDCVVVLWYEFSEWILIEAAFAEFLGKPCLFICYDGLQIPAPFSQKEMVTFSSDATPQERVLSLQRVFAGLKRIIPGSLPPDEVPSFSQLAFRAALIEELEKGKGVPHKTRFENMLRTGLKEQDLAKRQLELVQELVDAPFDKLPAETYPHDEYQLRYDLGSYLGELNGIPEKKLLSLTGVIEPPDKKAPFRAMRYFVTQGLFQQFSRSNEGLGAVNYYLPYIINLSIDPWFEHIQLFIDWLKVQKFQEYRGMNVRLPTFDEWKLMAGDLEYWNPERLVRCNLTAPNNGQPGLSAVGVFHDSQSSLGCFDIIGNAWELVLEHTEAKPSVIVGWSYEQETKKVNSWEELSSPIVGAENFPISFRLVISK